MSAPTASAPVLLLLLARRVGATTLSAQLASTYSSCYDPAGMTCTCTGIISLESRSLTGTIPPELSACTGVDQLCVLTPPPTQPSRRREESVARRCVVVAHRRRDTGARSRHPPCRGRCRAFAPDEFARRVRSGLPSCHDVPARTCRRHHPTRAAQPPVSLSEWSRVQFLPRPAWWWHRYLVENALTGTIPVELSTMTSIFGLCVRRHAAAPLGPTPRCPPSGLSL